jgi:cytosine/adenosine deaminase-related metal-dependent hydrolase
VALGTKIFRAGWVCPISGPPIRDGAVAVRHWQIVEVGPFAELNTKYAGFSMVVDRGRCTIVPGLVNAHTHLELSEFTPPLRPTSFVEWVTRLVPRGQVSLENVHQSVKRSIPIGVDQCLKFGVTCVGDISRHCTASRPILKKRPLRVVSFGEVQAMAQRRTLLEERIDTAIDGEFASSLNLTIGLSPHAPYSVEMEGYRRCVAVANEEQLPLATHLAETPDEATFLAQHTGAFRDLWSLIGAWDDAVPRFEGGPIRFAKAVGLLDYPTVLAHVNYCDDEEMELLAKSKCSVVYCPRTHEYFRHPPHRWREMLNRGINVALGTDSCASSPNLNLLEEMRLVRRLAPDFPVEEIWKMATMRGAEAIGMNSPRSHKIHDPCGSLEPKNRADFVVFKTESDDPLKEILDENLLPRETYILGRKERPKAE